MRRRIAASIFALLGTSLATTLTSVETASAEDVLYRWTCLADHETCLRITSDAPTLAAAQALNSSVVPDRGVSNSTAAATDVDLPEVDDAIARADSYSDLANPFLEQGLRTYDTSIASGLDGSGTDIAQPGPVGTATGGALLVAAPERTGSGYGYRTARGQGNDKDKYFGWTLGGPHYSNYDLCTKSVSSGSYCEVGGRIGVNAAFTMSGRGTNRLVSTIRVVSGRDVFTYHYIRCDELGFGQGRCGSRYGFSDVRVRPGQENTERYANEMYFLRDASTYDLSFRFEVQAEGYSRSGSPYYDSDNIKCPTNDRPCYL